MSTEFEKDVEVIDREEVEIKEPRKYAVIMINDDYTPMDFVIEMLMTYFGHGMSAAVEIMMNVHEKGRGVAGVYTRDIAQTKAAIVMSIAQQNEFPLMCMVEPE